MPDKEMKIVPDHRSDVLNGSSCPSKEHRRSEYLRLSEEKRTRRRVEMKQLRKVWRSCTRDNVEADDSHFVLNPAAD